MKEKKRLQPQDLLYFIPGYYYFKHKIYLGAFSVFLVWLFLIAAALLKPTDPISLLVLVTTLGLSISYFLRAQFETKFKGGIIEFITFRLATFYVVCLGSYFIFLFLLKKLLWTGSSGILEFFLAVFLILPALLVYFLWNDSQKKKLAKIDLDLPGEITLKKEILFSLSWLKKASGEKKTKWILKCFLFCYISFLHLIPQPEVLGKFTWLLSPYLGWAAVVLFFYLTLISDLIDDIKKTKSLKVALNRTLHMAFVSLSKEMRG